MTRQRDLLVNIERMRREMDEFFGDAWPRSLPVGRRTSSFSPRVDVYYSEAAEPGAASMAVIKADLAGVDPDSVSLEIAGRELVISGRRPVRDTEGRAYQQVEIPTGDFRRVVELGAEVLAEEAKATFEDGILRIELPIRAAGAATRRVPIERAD